MTRNRTKVWDLNYVTVITSATTKPCRDRSSNQRVTMSRLTGFQPERLRTSGDTVSTLIGTYTSISVRLASPVWHVFGTILETSLKNIL